MVYWFFVLDLLEFPIAWHKVGGVVVQWIGYQLDLGHFSAGISDRKRRWIKDWIARKRAEGGVVGRELKAALGRLPFVVGALKHVRPFLGPLYAWSSALAAGTFAAFPDAVSMRWIDVLRRRLSNPLCCTVTVSGLMLVPLAKTSSLAAGRVMGECPLKKHAGSL